MDAGSVKPIGSVLVANIPRSSVEQVPTITPPDKAVTAPSEGSAGPSLERRAPAPEGTAPKAENPQPEHQVKRGYRAHDTGTLVFQIEDEVTKRVLLQIPSEDLLRVKQAYHDVSQNDDQPHQAERTA